MLIFQIFVFWFSKIIIAKKLGSYKTRAFKTIIFYINFKKLTVFLCVHAKLILNSPLLIPLKLKGISKVCIPI